MAQDLLRDLLAKRVNSVQYQARAVVPDVPVGAQGSLTHTKFRAYAVTLGSTYTWKRNNISHDGREST
eukprot:935897-Pyramimonas_sp.AAC.1